MTWKELTIGEVAARYPKSIAVFKEKKIDFCCGGKTSLKKELLKNQDLEGLLEDLVNASQGPEAGTKNLLGMNQSQLVDYIIVEFHEKHRKDLPQILALANKVENVHQEHEEAPRGLTGFLTQMSDELLAHMGKEEMILFPMLKANPQARPFMPIQKMMAEHDDHKVAIERLAKLAHNFQPPSDACNSWISLYKYLEDFVDELKEHIHTENNILFPMALGEEKTSA